MGDDALTLARKCAEAMWAGDRASQGLGIEILSIGPGRAILAMTVGESMINAQGTCHGGFIFALADSAFAFACNTYDRRAVAQHCAVTFLRTCVRQSGFFRTLCRLRQPVGTVMATVGR